MSLRPHDLAGPKKLDRVGSLFGAAIGAPTGGFWAQLAVSPPRTPPTASVQYEALPPEFHLDALPAAVATSDQIDSIFPSWKHDFADAVLVTFVQSSDVLTLRVAPKLVCANVVHPTMVRADEVAWRPMSCEASGATGHLFTLSHRGQPTCRIEVTLVGEEVGRIVVVQPEYSAMAVAARLTAPSSLLIYDDIRAHINSLQNLRQTLSMSVDVGYVPTHELVVTRALDNLVLKTDHTIEAAAARRYWKTTKLLMAALSAATADCVDTYTRSELGRVGQRVSECDNWRRLI